MSNTERCGVAEAEVALVLQLHRSLDESGQSVFRTVARSEESVEGKSFKAKNRL